MAQNLVIMGKMSKSTRQMLESKKGPKLQSCKAANSLIERRQQIIEAPEKKSPRKWGNNGHEVVPVAAKAGKRPQVGSNARLWLSMYTPHKELRGKARAERQWLNDPRMVFVG